MCHPKVGNLNDKSTYFKTQENFTFVFEGNCPKLRIFALFFFVWMRPLGYFQSLPVFTNGQVSPECSVCIHGKLNLLSVIHRSPLLSKIDFK